MSDIVLFGATGFTGTLIAEELSRRSLPFAIAGRNRESLECLSSRLGGVPLRVADARQPYTLNALMEGVRVLINCVGPFLHYGEPVLNAAVENRVHYLDTTGEQTWMKRMLNRYDGVALRGRTTVINGMAFEFAVGDWLAALAARELGRSTPIDSISVAYSMTRGGMTRGTALSLIEMAGEKGWSYEGGHWQRRHAGWTRRTMPFSFGEREVLWMPFGETLLVPRHERVQTVLTYSRLPRTLARFLPLAARVGPAIRGILRPLARSLVARFPEGPDEATRADHRIALTAEARRGGERALVRATTTDPYGLTARIAALGAELLLTGSAQRGVRAPAHLPIAPDEALGRIGVALHD